MSLLRIALSLLLLTPIAEAAPTLPSDPAPLLRAAEVEVPAFLKTVDSLVSIDSGTGNREGLAQVADLLSARLAALGGKVERVAAADGGVGDNLVARFKGHGQARILMMIHYDTVFGPGEVAKRPFRIEGGRMYGPGVADARGSLALILHALKILHDQDYNGYGELTVLFNTDEEKGSFGSRDLIHSLAGQQDYILSYEPPDTDAVTVATNGINYLFLRVEGRASHAGSALEQGRNAVIELSHQLLQLRDLGDAKKGTTVNWTVTKGGDRRNVIPAHAEAEGDMRYSDYAEIDRVTSDVRRISAAHLVPDTTVTFDLQRGRPPLPRNPASERLADLAQRIYGEAGRSLESKQMRYGTDAGYAYQPGAESPAVLETLGLVGAGLHSPDEYAELASIAPRLYLTVRLVQTLSSGNQ